LLLEMSLAELGFEMPWLGMSPWLALLLSVVVITFQRVCVCVC
jgi:hypothetical protein